MNIANESLVLGLQLAVKASIVALVALICTRMLARSNAAARHAVWVTAVTVILFLPLLSLSSRKIAVPIPTSQRPSVETSVRLGPQQGAGENASNSAVISWPGGERPEVTRPIPWAGVVWGTYLIGVALVLLPFVLGLQRANAIARRASPVDRHHEWRNTLPGIGRSRFYSWVSLVTSREIEAPVTFGFLRPVVVLPQDVTAWSAQQRRDALAHEFAHVARCDWAVQVVGLLVTAMHWFNPLVWMVASRLALEAERACDERVVQLGASPHDYAEHLVALTRKCSNGYPPTTIAMSRDSFLASRVKSLLSQRRTGMKSRMLLTALAVTVTAGGLLLALLEPTTAARHRSARQAVTRSPLMEAVHDGDVDDVKQLIAGGADVNERHDGEGTPLILAATYGRDTIALLLIDAGADVNRSEVVAPRDLMRTPLTAAARNGHDGMVEQLLAKGAKIDAAPPGDATALMEAAKNDHPKIVSMLIRKGADVKRKIDGDGNAITAAARGGNVEIAKMMVAAGADVNASVPGDGNALIIAVRRGDRKMIDYLLSQGADPNAYVPGDESVMVAAAESGDTQLMRLLLDAAAK